MVDKLKLAQELAVDLEYHSTRSFTGFLCLMQISTRDEDFVVDVIRLRKEVREGKLGGVLADPSIVKVRRSISLRYRLIDGIVSTNRYSTERKVTSCGYSKISTSMLLAYSIPITPPKFSVSTLGTRSQA